MSTRLRHLRLSPDGTTLVVKSEKGGVDHELALDELLEVRTHSSNSSKSSNSRCDDETSVLLCSHTAVREVSRNFEVSIRYPALRVRVGSLEYKRKGYVCLTRNFYTQQPPGDQQTEAPDRMTERVGEG